MDETVMEGTITEDKTTEGKGKVVNNGKLMTAASCVLAVACGGLAGIAYTTKCIAYKKALASAYYYAQLAEARKGAVEAVHQSAINALNTGSPLFDCNDYGSARFPKMDGLFSKFAEAHPVLSQKILDRVHSHQNIDVLNQYAQERGYNNYNEFLESTNEIFAHLFNPDGTLSPNATMQDIDLYYYTFADMYNYLGNEAISFYADDLIKEGIDPSLMEGMQIITTQTTDSAGNVINSWTVDLAPGVVNEINSSAGLDAGEVAGALAIGVCACAGGYFVGKKVIDYFKSRSAGDDESMDTIDTDTSMGASRRDVPSTEESKASKKDAETKDKSEKKKDTSSKKDAGFVSTRRTYSASSYKDSSLEHK